MGTAGNRPRDFTPSPSRMWTAPDGKRYRLWLEEATRHVRHSDPRPILTFVDIEDPARQETRRVGQGIVLEELSDMQLAYMLAARGSRS